MPMSPQPAEHKNRIAFSDLGRKSDLGANWDNGVRAGLFACDLIESPVNANTNIGCRLATRARSRLFMESRTARDLGFALRSGQKNRRNTNRAGVASSLRANVAPTPYLGCKPDLGASWVDGVRAGLFACNLNNPASNANTNIGCRLAIRARSRLFMESRTARDLGFAFRSGQENRRNTNRAGAASSLRASAAPAPHVLGRNPDLGADWSHGVRAGLFACYLYHAASNAGTTIGCRLATRARSRLFMEGRTARDLGIAFRSGQENRRNTNRAGAASSLRVSAAPAL